MIYRKALSCSRVDVNRKRARKRQICRACRRTIWCDDCEYHDEKDAQSLKASVLNLIRRL
jgi:hypothetical protein